MAGKIKSQLEILVGIHKDKDDTKKIKSSLTDIDKQSKKIRKKNDIAKAFKTAGMAMGKAGAITSAVGKKTLTADQAAKRLAGSTARIAATQKRYKEEIRAGGQAMRQLFGAKGAKNLNRQMKETQKVSRATKKARRQTSFWSMNFLTFLFVGQQVMMMFRRLATASINAFKAIAGETNKAAQAVTALGIGVQFVRFSIGQAIATSLLPYLDKIMNIISVVGDWISSHQKLTAGLVIGGIVFGFLIMVMGQFALALNSIINIIKMVKVALLAHSLLGLGTVLLIVAAILAVFAILWMANFGNIRDFLKETLGIIWILFKSVFGDLFNLVKTVFGLIVAVLAGDWDKAGTLTKKAFILLLKIIAKTVGAMGAILYNLVAFVINVFGDLVGVLIDLGSIMLKVIMSPWLIFKATVKQIFADVFNNLAKMINGIIDKFAGLTIAGKKPFAFLEGLKLKQVDKSLSIMGQFKEEWKEANTIMGVAAKTMRSIQLPTLKSESFQKFTDAIDAGAARKLEGVNATLAETSESATLGGTGLLASILNKTPTEGATAPVTFNITNNLSALGDSNVAAIVTETMEKSLEEAKEKIPGVFAAQSE